MSGFIGTGKKEIQRFKDRLFWPAALKTYPSTFHKDVRGALCVHSVPVEVVRLEEFGPELLFTKSNT
jgi:hypothetical protein